jgi:putative membrane protein
MLGKLALLKAQSDDVAEFGKTMVEDHTQSDLALLALNREKKLGLMADMGAKPTPSVGAAPGADKSAGHREAMQKLMQASGAQFDREYVNAMVAKHTETLNAVKVAQQQVSDPDVKKYLEDVASTVEGHQKKAQELAENLAKESGSKPDASSAPRSSAPSGATAPAPKK